MIPLWDDNSQERTRPYVNYVLIALNLVCFLAELQSGAAQAIRHWGAIPALITNGQALITLSTSMFLHAGWLHLLGNMLFLWVFGDNVEDAFGHPTYLFFYLGCGWAASIAQVILAPHALVPLVGASGAISGVLAAYVILFPKNRVEVLILFRLFLKVPAWVMIGVWIAIQVFSGVAEGSRMAAHGGVAYVAHMGGFAAGVLVTMFMRKPAQPVPAPVAPMVKAAAAGSGNTVPERGSKL